MLAILRRKLGLGNTTHPLQPPANQPVPADGSTILVGGTPGPNPSDPTAQAGTLEDFGFVWPAEAGAWSASHIPLWLQEVVSIFIFLFDKRIFLFSFFFFSPQRMWALIKETEFAQNITDLGLPTNGNDGVFLNSPHWAVDMPPTPEAR
jgi:hypothetical protein